MIIVTGGTHGIGRATAERLARDGNTVLIAGRDEEAGQAVAAATPGIAFQRTDVGSDDECRALVDTALSMGQGKLTGLVNNAGFGERHDFLKTSADDWDRVMNLNARSVFLMTRLCIEGLIAGQGAVVNVASVAGHLGEENLAIYTASKAAVIGMTRALALELGAKVRFNAVCPGQVATRMMGAILNDELRRKPIEMRIPLERFAGPDEIGDVIAWLLSHDARYVNGVVLPVDGGETAGLRNPRQAC
ncbi:SDR family NAD(P)-dependent oxidoreductase [Chachezhania sediminis]|uniref:SDR family NAD(P)-dependent oxidoreductase n=1 Tax=Chachezhania sediminis TaxID=2599291 RepID=UPI00131A8B16|nr:SDR family oxidoreductase [Chachezhania sediminis]